MKQRNNEDFQRQEHNHVYIFPQLGVCNEDRKSLETEISASLESSYRDMSFLTEQKKKREREN